MVYSENSLYISGLGIVDKSKKFIKIILLAHALTFYFFDEIL